MSAQASDKLQATELSPEESAVTPPEEKLSVLETRKLWAWNRLLLPLMIGMVVGLTLFFFAASMFQLYALQESIADSPKLDLKAQLAEMPLPEKASEIEAQQRWKTLSLLEEHAVRQRYHQANVLLMARVWVRYLGFVTGMIMALVGAVFVLGKLREARTELSVGTGEHQGKISTHSPGLILASLGTLLMFTTLVTHHRIDVNDGPLYVLLPYSQVTLPASLKSKPEDVTKLRASTPGQGNAVAAPKPDSGGSAQQELDATFDQIDRLINTQGQGTE